MAPRPVTMQNCTLREKLLDRGSANLFIYCNKELALGKEGWNVKEGLWKRSTEKRNCLSEENYFASLIFLCKKVERICIKRRKTKKKRKDYSGHHTLCSIDVQLAGCPYAIPVIFVSNQKQRFKRYTILTGQHISLGFLLNLSWRSQPCLIWAQFWLWVHESFMCYTDLCAI